jgi:hypothetical protein
VSEEWSVGGFGGRSAKWSLLKLRQQFSVRSTEEAMSYTGTIIGGVVKLPPEVSWSDGTLVRIEPVEPANDRHIPERWRPMATLSMSS